MLYIMAFGPKKSKLVAATSRIYKHTKKSYTFIGLLMQANSVLHISTFCPCPFLMTSFLVYIFMECYFVHFQGLRNLNIKPVQHRAVASAGSKLDLKNMRHQTLRLVYISVSWKRCRLLFITLEVEVLLKRLK